jgi:hypothetical protein
LFWNVKKKDVTKLTIKNQNEMLNTKDRQIRVKTQDAYDSFGLRSLSNRNNFWYAIRPVICELFDRSPTQDSFKFFIELKETHKVFK